MKVVFVFIISYFLSGIMSAQTENSLLQAKIDFFHKTNQIDSVNQLLKNNTFPPEYLLKCLTKNLNELKKSSNEKGLADTYLELGNFWHQQANKLKAFENYLEAETIARKIKDKKLLGTCLMNKSTLLDNNIKQEKIKILREAYELYKEEKDTLNLIKVHLNIGVAYALLYEKNNNSLYSRTELREFRNNSFENYSQAEKLNLHFQNKELQGALYVYYGEWYQFEKQNNKAIESFEKAQKVLKETPNTKGQTYCIYMLAKINAQQKQYNTALELLGEAEKLSEKNSFNDYLSRIYDEYVNIYSDLGDYKKALEYNKLYTQKSVELTEQSNNDKMQILSLEKNAVENKLKMTEYESNSEMDKILILSSILLAIFITGISYLVIKNNRKKIESLEKNKIITEIQLKNQQLEDELLKEKMNYAQNHLMTVANLSDKIMNFLDELKTQVKDLSYNSAYQQGVNDLRISFSKILINKSYLTELNTLSSELNQEFFIYVRKNYPEVTPKDEQLLSFIILNMTSREIGKTLNISTDSVYKKRHRLRKKLNIEKDSIPEFYEETIRKLNN